MTNIKFVLIHIERERMGERNGERERTERERERERKREREGGIIQQEMNFIFKSFQLCLYQLHVYNKLLLGLSNLQIVFIQILIFHYYRNGNTKIKKLIIRQL